jgi:hypothetical protein
MIVGETLSGRREVVSKEGRFFTRSDSPEREHSMSDRARRTAKRSGEFMGNSTRKTGQWIGDTARRSGDLAVRSGRTIVHTPQIIGESLSGRREVISRDGRVLSVRDRESEQHDARGQRLYATTR